MMEILLMVMGVKEIEQLLKLIGFVQEVHRQQLILVFNALQDIIKIVLLTQKIEFQFEEMVLKLVQRNEMMEILIIVMAVKEIALQ